MLGFVGLNLMFDKDAINPVATNVVGINNVELNNGIIDHFNVTRNVTDAWTGVIPTEWVNDTIMNADFEGSVGAGNVDYITSQLSKILIKRKLVDDVTSKWETLFEIPVVDTSSLTFTVSDFTNQSERRYIYALVPVLIQNQSGIPVEVEGNYEVSDEVFSKFDGVFICDSTAFYKLYANVGYGNMTTVQNVGVHPTLGSKYPIVVANSHTQYNEGNLSGTILPPNYLEDGNLDRLQIVKEREKLTNFLCDKKPKILKDWNGNIWLVIFTGDPSVSFDDSYGMGMAHLDTSWTEVGNPSKVSDLKSTGVLRSGGGE